MKKYLVIKIIDLFKKQKYYIKFKLLNYAKSYLFLLYVFKLKWTFPKRVFS